MKTYEFTARTTEEAISTGLESLGLSISEVKVDIIEEGSKGLFGLFGSRPAKIRLTVKEDENADEVHDLFDGMLEENVEKKETKAEKKVKAEAPAVKAAEKKEATEKPAKKEKAEKKQAEEAAKARSADEGEDRE